MTEPEAQGVQTYGRTWLQIALRVGRISQPWLARRLGVVQSTISHYVSGKKVPEDVQRLALETLFGIPRDAWITAEKWAGLVERKLAPEPESWTKDEKAHALVTTLVQAKAEIVGREAQGRRARPAQLAA